MVRGSPMSWLCSSSSCFKTQLCSLGAAASPACSAFPQPWQDTAGCPQLWALLFICLALFSVSPSWLWPWHINFSAESSDTLGQVEMRSQGTAPAQAASQPQIKQSSLFAGSVDPKLGEVGSRCAVLGSLGQGAGHKPTLAVTLSPASQQGTQHPGTTEQDGPCRAA